MNQLRFVGSLSRLLWTAHWTFFWSTGVRSLECHKRYLCKDCTKRSEKNWWVTQEYNEGNKVYTKTIEAALVIVHPNLNDDKKGPTLTEIMKTFKHDGMKIPPSNKSTLGWKRYFWHSKALHIQRYIRGKNGFSVDYKEHRNQTCVDQLFSSDLVFCSQAQPVPVFKSHLKAWPLHSHLKIKFQITPTLNRRWAAFFVW